MAQCVLAEMPVFPTAGKFEDRQSAPTIKLLSIRKLSRLRCPKMSGCLDCRRKHHAHNT